MLADTHNHTSHFSPDAHMTIGELISVAVSRRLNVVAVTEHYEYDNPDPDDNIQTFDIDEYDQVFPTWQAQCPESLTLLKGIEFGYQTHTASVIDDIIASRTFDTVVLSNHLFRGIDVAFNKEVYKLDDVTRNREYISKMAEMAENVLNFNVAAHYDYINKYNPDPVRDILYEDCPREFDRLFEALIAKDKALEINTAGCLRRAARFAEGSSRTSSAAAFKPDAAVIKRYLSMGGRLITIGSDAHKPSDLGTAIEDFSLYLKSLGVRELCYFKAGQPQTYGV